MQLRIKDDEVNESNTSLEDVRAITLYQFGALHNLTLHIRSNSILQCYQVSFDGVYIKTPGFIASVFGSGKTKSAAIKDYVKSIAGKEIEVYLDKKRYIVPDDLRP